MGLYFAADVVRLYTLIDISSQAKRVTVSKVAQGVERQAVATRAIRVLTVKESYKTALEDVLAGINQAGRLVEKIACITACCNMALSRHPQVEAR
eukprot:scaffold140858_cov17-Tisochrysis_lutea.AAC.1